MLMNGKICAVSHDTIRADLDGSETSHPYITPLTPPSGIVVNLTNVTFENRVCLPRCTVKQGVSNCSTVDVSHFIFVSFCT